MSCSFTTPCLNHWMCEDAHAEVYVTLSQGYWRKIPFLKDQCLVVWKFHPMFPCETQQVTFFNLSIFLVFLKSCVHIQSTLLWFIKRATTSQHENLVYTARQCNCVNVQNRVRNFSSFHMSCWNTGVRVIHVITTNKDSCEFGLTVGLFCQVKSFFLSFLLVLLFFLNVCSCSFSNLIWGAELAHRC